MNVRTKKCVVLQRKHRNSVNNSQNNGFRAASKTKFPGRTEGSHSTSGTALPDVRKTPQCTHPRTRVLTKSTNATGCNVEKPRSWNLFVSSTAISVREYIAAALIDRRFARCDDAETSLETRSTGCTRAKSD